jgi:hypothetical protein
VVLVGGEVLSSPFLAGDLGVAKGLVWLLKKGCGLLCVL